MNRNSVVFGGAIENIQTDFEEHFKDMRRKTMILSNLNRPNPLIVKSRTIEESKHATDEVSEKNPSQEQSEGYQNSDSSMREYRNNRRNVVLSKTDIDPGVVADVM